jgi:hypothetical protein
MNRTRLTPFVTGCILCCISVWIWGWHDNIAPLRRPLLVVSATCMLSALPLLVRPAERRHTWDRPTVILLTPVVVFGLLAVWFWSIVETQLGFSSLR